MLWVRSGSFKIKWHQGAQLVIYYVQHFWFVSNCVCPFFQLDANVNPFVCQKPNCPKPAQRASAKRKTKNARVVHRAKLSDLNKSSGRDFYSNIGTNPVIERPETSLLEFSLILAHFLVCFCMNENLRNQGW